MSPNSAGTGGFIYKEMSPNSAGTGGFIYNEMSPNSAGTGGFIYIMRCLRTPQVQGVSYIRGGVQITAWYGRIWGRTPLPGFWDIKK